MQKKSNHLTFLDFDGFEPIINSLFLSKFDIEADTTIATTTPTIIASALLNGADSNLTSLVVNPDNSSRNGAFETSTSALFGITDRTVGPLLADDSFTGTDDFGILGRFDTNRVFAVADTDNRDQTGIVTAEWTFDVSNATEITAIAIDMAAMGNFEEGFDQFLITADFDGVLQAQLFSIQADNALSQTYQLEDGTTRTIDDPLLVDIGFDDTNAVLSNQFSTFIATLPPGITADMLTIRLEAITNGREEVFALRDIVIEGLLPSGQTFTGTSGDDVLRGTDFADILRGLDGDDILLGTPGGDEMNGGTGYDTVSYSFAQNGVTIDIVDQSNNGGDAFGDTYFSIARWFGSQHDDTFYGSSTNNVFRGRGGDDTFYGYEGADTFYGEAGNDTYYGGDGSDIASYALSASAIRLDLTNPSSSTGDASGDVFNSIERINATRHDDFMRGSTGEDRFFGLEGDDDLYGNDGDDWLYGSIGEDRLYGQDGVDRLFGGTQDDFLVGGAGNDRFYFGSNDGTDNILDFDQNGNDLIIFQAGSGITSMADLSITQSGADTHIHYSSSSLIVLENTLISTVDSTDFAFQ